MTPAPLCHEKGRPAAWTTACDLYNFAQACAETNADQKKMLKKSTKSHLSLALHFSTYSIHSLL